MNVLVIIYIIGVIASLILNGVVIIVLLSKGRDLNLLDVLVASLAISDFLQAGIGYPIEIHSVINYDVISEPSCTVAGFSVTFLALVSISHLVGIAIERFLILRYPWKGREWSAKPSLSFYVIIPSWSYGLIWAILPLVGWSSYQREQGSNHRCSIDLRHTNWNVTSYSYSLLVCCYVIPVLIMFACCVFIQGELKRMHTQAAYLRMGDRITIARRKREIKHSVMTIVLIGTFLVAWTPYAACVFVLSIQKHVSGALLNFSALFAKMSTLYNPIIYSVLMKEFRIRSKQILGFKRNVVFPFHFELEAMKIQVFRLQKHENEFNKYL